jgi:hypothetical protein
MAVLHGNNFGSLQTASTCEQNIPKYILCTFKTAQDIYVPK